MQTHNGQASLTVNLSSKQPLVSQFRKLFVGIGLMGSPSIDSYCNNYFTPNSFGCSCIRNIILRDRTITNDRCQIGLTLNLLDV